MVALIHTQPYQMDFVTLWIRPRLAKLGCSTDITLVHSCPLSYIKKKKKNTNTKKNNNPVSPQITNYLTV